MSRRQQYTNLLACALFVALLLFLFHAPRWCFGIPALLLLAGLLLAPVRSAVLRLWLKLSHVLGTVNTAILLFLIYFLIISPYALLFRKKTGGSYVLRRPRTGRSLFRNREHAVQKEDFEKSW